MALEVAGSIPVARPNFAARVSFRYTPGSDTTAGLRNAACDGSPFGDNAGRRSQGENFCAVQIGNCTI